MHNRSRYAELCAFYAVPLPLEHNGAQDGPSVGLLPCAPTATSRKAQGVDACGSSQSQDLSTVAKRQRVTDGDTKPVVAGKVPAAAGPDQSFSFRPALATVDEFWSNMLPSSSQSTASNIHTAKKQKTAVGVNEFWDSVLPSNAADLSEPVRRSNNGNEPPFSSSHVKHEYTKVMEDKASAKHCEQPGKRAGSEPAPAGGNAELRRRSARVSGRAATGRTQKREWWKASNTSEKLEPGVEQLEVVRRFLVQRDDTIEATMLRKVAVAVGDDVWSGTKTIVDNGEVVTLLVDPVGSTEEFARVQVRSGAQGYIRRTYLKLIPRRQSKRPSTYHITGVDTN